MERVQVIGNIVQLPDRDGKTRYGGVLLMNQAAILFLAHLMIPINEWGTLKERNSEGKIVEKIAIRAFFGNRQICDECTSRIFFRYIADLIFNQICDRSDVYLGEADLKGFFRMERLPSEWRKILENSPYNCTFD